MPTGASHLYYPDPQPDPKYPLVPDNSYFQVKIHDAQAFYPANVLKQAKYLIFRSSVGSSFPTDLPTKSLHTESLHKFTTLKRNESFHLGVNTNLTDWLPASTTDSLRITLSYRVIQGKPIEAFVGKMEQLQLETVMSLIRPDMAVAVKISEIVGHLLSYFLHEGEQTELFSPTIDLNLADLKAGYHVVLGSLTNEPPLNALEIKNGYLTARGGHELTRYCYIVLQVQTTPRRKQESIRKQAWGELLQECKDEALNTTIGDPEDRAEAYQKLRIRLEQLKRLALKDHSFLQSEIEAVIGEVRDEVDKKLGSRKTPETKGLEEYSAEWQQLLGVRTPQELHHAVRDYQDAVELTERLLQQYQQPFR